MSGAKEQQPRWKRCLAATDRDLGDILGKAYVAEAFPPKARARALELVHNLEAALGDKNHDAGVDERAHPSGGARQAQGVRREDRLPGQVA
jgi:hypothetical protein